MARMYSRKKGKSGSTKPSKKVKPTWTSYKPKEIEMLIVKKSKEGLTSSQIGIILRDSYGVPCVKEITGKTITTILKDNKVAPEIPEDLKNLVKKAIKVKKHLEKNKQDKTGKRGQQLAEAKVFRLIKYYKKTGELAKDWNYDEKSIRLYT